MTGSNSQNLLQERLNRLYHLLRRIEGLYQQQQAAYQRHAHHYVEYKTNWRGGMYWIWVLVLTFTFSMTVLMINAANFGSSMGSSSTDVGAQLGMLSLFLLPLPIAMVASGILVGVRNVTVPEQNSKREILNREAAAKIHVLATPELAPINEHLLSSTEEYRNGFPDWQQSTYLQNPEDVGALWHIVHDGLVPDISRAIQIYKQDLHNQQMQDIARAQLGEQQRATRAAQLNGIVNATLQGAMVGTVVDQGRKNRAAMASPRTITIKHK